MVKEIWLAALMLFKIGQVECFTQFGSCSDELAARAQFLLGRPIYWPLPRQEIAQKYSGLTTVSEVTVYRRLPQTVVVAVTLRRPLVVVEGSRQSRAVVDEEGVIFAPGGESALPVLSLDGEIQLGTKLTAIQLQAAQLLSQVAGLVQLPVRGILQGEVLRIAVTNGPVIILDVNAAQNSWDASLQAIWSRSKIGGKIPRQIDLRFSPAAVSF